MVFDAVLLFLGVLTTDLTILGVVIGMDKDYSRDSRSKSIKPSKQSPKHPKAYLHQYKGKHDIR